MKTKTLTAVALILAALPVMGFAQAAPGRPPMPQLDFATADADGSGGISAEEWTAYARTLAQTMRAERLGARADALIAAADADGDGVLTRDELIGGMAALGDERREARAEGRGMFGGRMHGEWRGDRDGMMRGERGEGCERGERGDRDRGHGFGDHDRGARGNWGGMRGHDRMHGHGDMRGQEGEGRFGMMDDGPRGGMMMEPGERAARAFDRMDFNGDGQIDAEELADAQRFLQRRMQMQDRMMQGQADN
ncbi:MAG: hypothetical protein Kow0013_11350 [Pararhodobacter sp.]